MVINCILQLTLIHTNILSLIFNCFRYDKKIKFKNKLDLLS
jgi:hypothetical protein